MNRFSPAKSLRLLSGQYAYSRTKLSACCQLTHHNQPTRRERGHRKERIDEDAGDSELSLHTRALAREYGRVWTQDWHLPHLSRNSGSTIAAIVNRSGHPESNLNPNLEPLSTAAGDRYGLVLSSSSYININFLSWVTNNMVLQSFLLRRNS